MQFVFLVCWKLLSLQLKAIRFSEKSSKEILILLRFITFWTSFFSFKFPINWSSFLFSDWPRPSLFSALFLGGRQRNQLWIKWNHLSWTEACVFLDDSRRHKLPKNGMLILNGVKWICVWWKWKRPHTSCSLYLCCTIIMNSDIHLNLD